MTGKERAALRAAANTLPAILHIGKEGVTDSVAQQAWEALEARELVKGSVLQSAGLTAREALGKLCERTHAQPVQCIGNRFVLYRKADKNSHYGIE
ncbi:MAG: YhbY family RNA-binding protein [Oscillospiraceae bacterium]|jgi:RNA-binding protein|nr:YhbY family RNA-binding protein [Oscillospiraceae bacterium]